MRVLLVTALLCPTILMAKDDDAPPPTPVNSCEGSEVFDADKGKCVDPQSSSLDRDDIYQTVRQLAYAGRYLDAQGVMEALPENDAGRLTYMGFTHRKLGNMTRAMAFYEEAIAQDPANIAARSYMGQGFVDQGRIEDAMAQLEQIRLHDGRGTWSERSLKNAIATGRTYSY